MTMKCQRLVRRAIKTVVFIACLTMCMYLIFDVIGMYSLYPTSVVVSLNPLAFVKLPGITVCSELSSTVLIEKLYNDNKSDPFFATFAGKTRNAVAGMLKKRSFREELLGRLHEMPLHKQHEYTVDQSQFIKNCEIPLPLGIFLSRQAKNKLGNKAHTVPFPGPLNTLSSSIYYYNYFGNELYHRINCMEITNIIETINAEFKCFSLFMQTDTKKSDLDHQIPKNVVENLRYLVYLTLNRDFMYNGLIYVHSPHVSHQYFAQRSVQQLDPDKMLAVNVGYDSRTLELLPSPYQTNCHDYRLDGYQCREDCITQCKVDQFMKNNIWPGDVYINQSFARNLTNIHLRSFNAWKNEAIDNDDFIEMSALSNCSQYCNKGEDCLIHEYNLSILRVNQRDADDWQSNHRFMVGVTPPKNVEMTNQHVPKYQNVELIVYIGGLVGTFLGLSILSVSSNFFSILACSNKYVPNFCPWCCCKAGPKEKATKVENEPVTLIEIEPCKCSANNGTQSCDV